MDFAIRAVPAAETDIIAKTVIHPNHFRLHLDTLRTGKILPPMRFSPGDFHFRVAIRKGLRKEQARLAKRHPVLPVGFRAEIPEE